jgi:hypothetical protein
MQRAECRGQSMTPSEVEGKAEKKPLSLWLAASVVERERVG